MDKCLIFRGILIKLEKYELYNSSRIFTNKAVCPEGYLIFDAAKVIVLFCAFFFMF